MYGENLVGSLKRIRSIILRRTLVGTTRGIPEEIPVVTPARLSVGILGWTKLGTFLEGIQRRFLYNLPQTFLYELQGKLLQDVSVQDSHLHRATQIIVDLVCCSQVDFCMSSQRDLYRSSQRDFCMSSQLDSCGSSWRNICKNLWRNFSRNCSGKSKKNSCFFLYSSRNLWRYFRRNS